jgi:hypothetical protein
LRKAQGSFGEKIIQMNDFENTVTAGNSVFKPLDKLLMIILKGKSKFLNKNGLKKVY